MLKTVIIDDEDIIRDGLERAIPWNDLGFELVGSASDGERAIELLQKTKPDVIITDIRMPFMTGLELVEFIKPMLPDAFIIIISGHDEFQYAQKALQLGVYDFVLKPFDFDHFLKILSKIKYEYTIKKSKHRKSLSPEDLFKLQNNFLSSLIFDTLPTDTIEHMIHAYELDTIRDYYFSCAIVQIDNFSLTIANYTFDQINEVNQKFYHVILDIIGSDRSIHIIHSNSGDALLIIDGSTISETMMRTNMLVNKLRDSFNRNSTHSLTIAYSQTVKSLENLSIAHRQAHEACNQRFVIGYGKDISYELAMYQQKTKSKEMSYPQIGFDRNQFINYVKTGDTKTITHYINQVFNTLVKNGHNSSLYVTMFVTSIYVEILNLLGTYGLSIGDLYDDPLELYKTLTLSQNVHDMRDLIIDMTVKSSQFLLTESAHSCDTRINEAKIYIQDNYSSCELTLQKVAESINMGVCYFSTMFKKETGESFINYLTNIRINRAKELFKTTSAKAYEISYMVGYNTPTYFSTLFKRITGYSPSEYRNILAKD